MDFSYGTPHGDGLEVIEHLLAGGEMVAAQLPSASAWSPERRLAASVLAAALTDVRDHHGRPAHRQRVASALRWIHSNDRAWPFSFLRLCEQFGLDPGWVRRVVRAWADAGPARRQGSPRFRHAA